MSWKNHIIIMNVTCEDLNIINNLIDKRIQKNINRRTNAKHTQWTKPELTVLNIDDKIASVKLTFFDYATISKMIDSRENKRKYQRVSEPITAKQHRITHVPQLKVVQFDSIV